MNPLEKIEYAPDYISRTDKLDPLRFPFHSGSSTVNLKTMCANGSHIWINGLGIESASCVCGERRQKTCKCPDCDTLHLTSEPVAQLKGEVE